MIGSVILKLLKDSTDLLEIIPEERIFPYVMNEGTAIPAMVYTVDAVNSDYSKSGWVMDTINFSIIVFSPSYSQLQSLITLIRLSLDFKKGDIEISEEETIRIGNIYFRTASEGYSLQEDCYLSRLSFSVNTYNY